MKHFQKPVALIAALIGVAVVLFLAVKTDVIKKPDTATVAVQSSSSLIIRPVQFWETGKPDPADPTNTFYQIYFDIVNLSKENLTVTVDEFMFSAPHRKFWVTTHVRNVEVAAGERVNKSITFVLNPNYHIPQIANDGFYCLFRYSHKECDICTEYKERVIYFYKNGKFEFVYKTS